MSEADVIRTWTPAGHRAAGTVARLYRADAQERADIRENIPAALWLSARRGGLKTDTPPALAMCVIRRALVGLIYDWRPSAYSASGDGGERSFGRRPGVTFGTNLGDTGGELKIPQRADAEPDGDPAGDLARAIRDTPLTAWEREVIASVGRGELHADIARRRGVTGAAVSLTLNRAIQKVRAAHQHGG